MKIHNFWLTWTICTSNESWRHSEFKLDIIKYNLFWKFLRFWIFQIFRHGFFEKKIFRTENLKNFQIQHPKFIFSTYFKHQKWKLHEGLTPLTSSQTKRQASKWQGGLIQPPPGLFRVNISRPWKIVAPNLSSNSGASNNQRECLIIIS